MEYRLSEHMTFKKLLRCSFPCVMTMIAISIYSVVDGFFVSNFAGKTPFAAVNLIYPFIMVLASLGFMMGAGGAALVSKKMGEGENEKANQFFSNCFFFSILVGIVCAIISLVFMPQIALAFGADEEMLPQCVLYGRIVGGSVIFFNIQNLFQSFFTAAEKPRLGFLVTIIAGVTNIILDWILIAGVGLGILGAAIGTVCGQAVGAILPIIYFVRKNKSSLRLRFARFDWKAIGRMASNGSSEFIANISSSAVSILLNLGLMRVYGQNGVGAYGIICYVWMIFAAIFIGFNIAVGPRVSYALGAKNQKELKNLFHKSLVLLAIFGVVQCCLSLALAVPISYAFAGYDEGLRTLTVKAMLIYSLVYLFLGYNMWGSSFFTALNNGFVSFLLSFIRLGILECLAILFLPVAFGGESIWWAIPAAEAVGVIMNLAVVFAFGHRYGYIGGKTPILDEKMGD